MSFNVFESEEELLTSARRLLDSGKLDAAAAGAYEELASAYAKLLKTTKRLVKLSDKNQEKLNEQAKELQKAAQLKEDVERIMRHDLKSPLTTVINLPQLLLMDDNLDEHQREQLGRIEEAGYTLLSMVNLSTSLFKMERGTYQLMPEGMDLAALVRKVFAGFEDTAEMRGIPLELHIEGESAAEDASFPIKAEELLCYSMLANLIGNALDASPKNQPVTVDLSLLPEGAASIVIRNSGEVPEEMRHCFFEKYATAGKTRGTGLGTYSARLIARAHGGDVTMNSEKGVVAVSVTLPRV